MVTNPLGDSVSDVIAPDPERLLAIGYTRVGERAAVQALFALDATLGNILRTTREPMVGQMRLTWWHDALTRLDTAPAPAEPVLAALARSALPSGVRGEALAAMVDGWEALLDGDVSDVETLELHARTRGVGLFAAVAAVVGAAPGDPVAPAGRGWALADLARNVGDPALAALALSLAVGPLHAATSVAWSRPARTLGALAHLARLDLSVAVGDARPVGAPRRVGRILMHRITGR